MAKKCVNCGADMEDGDVFCPSCGQKYEEQVIEEKEEKRNVCPNCGSENEDGSLFCATCGTKLIEESLDESVKEEITTEEIVDNEPSKEENVIEEAKTEPVNNETTNNNAPVIKEKKNKTGLIVGVVAAVVAVVTVVVLFATGVIGGGSLGYKYVASGSFKEDNNSLELKLYSNDSKTTEKYEMNFSINLSELEEDGSDYANDYFEYINENLEGQKGIEGKCNSKNKTIACDIKVDIKEIYNSSEYISSYFFISGIDYESDVNTNLENISYIYNLENLKYANLPEEKTIEETKKDSTTEIESVISSINPLSSNKLPDFSGKTLDFVIYNQKSIQSDPWTDNYKIKLNKLDVNSNLYKDKKEVIQKSGFDINNVYEVSTGRSDDNFKFGKTSYEEYDDGKQATLYCFTDIDETNKTFNLKKIIVEKDNAYNADGMVFCEYNVDYSLFDSEGYCLIDGEFNTCYGYIKLENVKDPYGIMPKTITVIDGPVKIRSYYTTSTKNNIGVVKNGETYSVINAVENEGYTWYEIGINQWVADDGTWFQKEY